MHFAERSLFDTMIEVPIVLLFGGHDPSGGAGLQADNEALASQGCRGASVLTVLTAQNTHHITSYQFLSPMQVTDQARAILNDLPIAAFKLGLLGSSAVIKAVCEVIQSYPDVPVIFDPVLAAGRSNHRLVDDTFCETVRTHLLPLTTVLTPNSQEARALVPEPSNLERCASQLMDYGAQWVLLTGTHEHGPTVVNTLYGPCGTRRSFSWGRLPGSYHGSGCTLAATVAAHLARGCEIMAAASRAQKYTWQSLYYAHRGGQGQSLPDRFFWTRSKTGGQGPFF